MLPLAQSMDFKLLGGVTTPLALAALCLLLASGLLRLVVRAKPNAVLRLIVSRGFILALVLGVLANVSFLVTASFNREVRIGGTVRDEFGAPVQRALVEIMGAGQRVTDDSGLIEFSIPDSRTAPSYEVITIMDGFATDRREISGPRPPAVKIELKRKALAAEEFVREASVIRLSHYIGVPQVDLTLELYNPKSQRISFDVVSVRLTDPDGRVIALPFQGIYRGPTGQFVAAPIPPLLLEAGSTQSYVVSFFRSDDTGAALLALADGEYPLKMQLISTEVPVFSEELAAKLGAFMEKRMIWKPGAWQIAMAGFVDGKSYSRTFKFELQVSEVERMLELKKHYLTGHGVHPSLRFWQFPDAGSTVTVPVTN